MVGELSDEHDAIRRRRVVGDLLPQIVFAEGRQLQHLPTLSKTPNT